MDENELAQCVCMIFEQILSHPDLESFRVPKGKATWGLRWTIMLSLGEIR